MSEKQPPYRVLAWIAQQPWAMLPAAYDVMMEIVTRRFTGEMLSADEKSARMEAARRMPATPDAPGSIAILPVYGVIAPRAGAFADISQEGTSLKAWSRAFQEAQDDPNITGIVGLFDTPGGSVYGLEETADMIFSARGRKPMTAVVENGMAASAGYYMASQFDELVASASSEVGSIGIVTRHEDLSKALEAAGVAVNFITAPEDGFKAEGNPFQPLSPEARAHIQSVANAYYDKFVKAVARGRKASQARVREDFGKGRMYGTDRAMAVGMIDRIATLQQVVEGMVSKRGKAARRAQVGGLAVAAGPMEAPMLREGNEEMSCANCSYMSKPAQKGSMGTCTRHNFTTDAAWMCDDHEMMMEDMEDMEDKDMDKGKKKKMEVAAVEPLAEVPPSDEGRARERQRAQARLLIAGREVA